MSRRTTPRIPRTAHAVGVASVCALCCDAVVGCKIVELQPTPITTVGAGGALAVGSGGAAEMAGAETGDAGGTTSDDPDSGAPSAGGAAQSMGGAPAMDAGAGGATTTVPTGSWRNVTANLANMDSECGNMSNVSAKPDEDLLIAGIALLGLWASNDGGSSWHALGNGKGSDTITNRTTSIVYDPADSKRFWESGLYNGGGVYRTDDDGNTFVQLGDVHHIDLVSVDLKDSARKTLLAGGHETAQALYLSEDAGMTWDSVGGALPAGQTCTTPLVLDAKTFLVGCSAPSGAIYRSTDGGKSWSPVAASGGFGAPLRASDGALYWVSPPGMGMVKSTDDGLDWTELDDSSMFMSVPPLELPDGRVVAVTQNGVIGSMDHGATFQPITAPLPYPDVKGLVYSTQQRAFFVWHFSCGFGGPVPVPEDAIMRYDYDYENP